ncbi:MAG: purine-binding chemotaxis protein CheW [Deltaproteobacteria bacterium]|nr:purine-binding chemotaxis protein CheW [Deltaproteobacteria bacterium]
MVVFALDDGRYGLALPSVRRVLRVVAITPLPEAPPIVLGVVDLGGTIVPVIDLRRRFGHPSRGVRLSDQLVVAHTGRRTVALLVDEARGVLEVPEEESVPARHILPGLELVEGAVKLPDGLVLIHDLERLLSLEEEAAIDRVLRAAAERNGGVGGGGEEPAGGVR